jgi:ammonia channel protein AmtB
LTLAAVVTLGIKKILEVTTGLRRENEEEEAES